MMSLFLGHASHATHFAAHTTASHAGGGLIESLMHTLLHGMAWRAGGRIINKLPLGLIILVAIGVGLFFLIRYVRNR